MIVYIDFSIFIEQGEAFGYVSGELELLETPQIGDSISFSFSESESQVCPPKDFGRLMTVTNRIISVNPELKRPLALSLSDVIAKDRENAMEIAIYFEKGFGLFAEIYEPDS